MSRLALILTAAVACSSVCSVVGKVVQAAGCKEVLVRLEKSRSNAKLFLVSLKKNMQYNGRAYENKDAQNLPMPESNGCSTMGIKVGGEEDFTSCCDLHDVCYQTCGLTQQNVRVLRH